MKNQIRQVYIAGKFSDAVEANIERNIKRATFWGLVVARLGGAPAIPHANTAHPAFLRVQEPEFWYRATLLDMRRCDCVLLTPGWKYSTGSARENLAAVNADIPIWDLSDDKRTIVETLIDLGSYLGGARPSPDTIRNAVAMSWVDVFTGPAVGNVANVERIPPEYLK